MPNSRRGSVRSVLPPRDRTKDIKHYAYFQGAISRGLWRFFAYRFTPATLWMLGLTFIFFFYGSSSLEIQAYTGLSNLFSVWIVALLSAELLRPRARIEARHSDRVSVDEVLPVELYVTQLRNQQQQLNIVPHELPPSLESVPPQGVLLPSLGYNQTIKAALGIRCTNRGLHQWSGFRAESDYPFHLWR